MPFVCVNLPCVYLCSFWVALVEVLIKLFRVPIGKLHMYLIRNPINKLLLKCIRGKGPVKRIITLMHIDSFYIYVHIFEHICVLK